MHFSQRNLIRTIEEFAFPSRFRSACKKSTSSGNLPLRFETTLFSGLFLINVFVARGIFLLQVILISLRYLSFYEFFFKCFNVNVFMSMP